MLKSNQYFRCVIYPTGGPQSLYTYLPIASANWDTFPYVWFNLDVMTYFPKGFKRKKIGKAPRSHFHLEHQYQIHYSHDAVSSLPNRCVATKCDRHWMGNIVVVKRGRADPLQVIHIELGEISFINAIISM